MLLSVKTVKSDWCVSIRLLLDKKSVGLLLVKCLLSISRLYGAGSCRQRLSGVCSKLVNQLSRVSR